MLVQCYFSETPWSVCCSSCYTFNKHTTVCKMLTIGATGCIETLCFLFATFCNSKFGPILIDYFFLNCTLKSFILLTTPHLFLFSFFSPPPSPVLYSSASLLFSRLSDLPVFPPGLLQRSQNPALLSFCASISHAHYSSGPLLSLACLHFWIFFY